MSLVNLNRLSPMMRKISRLLWGCALLAVLASGQDNQTKAAGPVAATPRTDVSDALGRLRDGTFFRADIVRIAESGRTEAIPDLKKQFDLTQDGVAKDSIASALVKLGDKDPAWWNYLVREATDAISTDAPSPWSFDAKGKLIPGTSAEFAAWAQAHTLSTSDALENAMINLPAKIVFLGHSGDSRAIPLLRQALLSPNYMIQTSAAMALAELHDKPSISLIIQACQQAPVDSAVVIARALVDFDDPQAQAAARVFRPGANGH